VVRGFWYEKLRKHRLEYIRFEINVRTGKSWLVFWGGKPGYQQWLYLQPEDIRPT
jgi:hypothetical protein